VGLPEERELDQGQVIIAAEKGRSGDGVRSALTPDAEAFRAIFSRYSRPVLAFIRHLLGEDRARAEDLAQETFVRAYHKLDAWRGDAAVSTWIFGIARNVVREAVKEKYKSPGRVETRLTPDLEDPRNRPDESIVAEEVRYEIRKALWSLSEDHRVVFVLRMFYKMKYGEIARVTGKSLAKVKTDVHRARLEMRRKLRVYLEKVP
jgi:RNA polymerase sigma-70 factor, ECF subfamily